MKPTKCDEGQENQTFYLGVRGQTEGKFRDLGLNIFDHGHVVQLRRFLPTLLLIGVVPLGVPST